MFKYDIDRAVRDIWIAHPLYNVIQWDYFSSGEILGQNENNALCLTQAINGPNRDLNRMLAMRTGTLDEVTERFWELHKRYMAPSNAQISNWRLDYLRQILFINEKYVKSEGVEIFKAVGPVSKAMTSEFPDSRDVIEEVRASGKGLFGMVELYQSLLGATDDNRVEILETRQEYFNDRRFNVVQCAKYLLAGYLAARQMEGLPDSRKWVASERNDDVTTAQLRYWPFLCCDLSAALGEPTQVNLNQGQLWDHPGSQVLFTNDNLSDNNANLRLDVQQLFTYSYIDPKMGLDKNIDEVNANIRGKPWALKNKGYQYTSVVHRGNDQNPWRHHNTTWDEAMITELNFEGLMATFDKAMERPPPAQGGYYSPSRSRSSSIVSMTPFGEEEPKAKEKEKSNMIPIVLGACALGYVFMNS